MTEALLALAARYEAATADQEAEVFHEIGHALWKAGQISGERRAQWTGLIEHGACLVIALTLVPPGWRLSHMEQVLVGGNWSVSLKTNHHGLYPFIPRDGALACAFGKTAGGVVSAAAFRAQAAR